MPKVALQVYLLGLTNLKDPRAHLPRNILPLVHQR